MVLRVECNGLGEQVDGSVVVLALEGFVSLILELVCLCDLISTDRSTIFKGRRGRTVDMVLECEGDPQEYESTVAYILAEIRWRESSRTFARKSCSRV
jgi:hypothetical protein